MTLKNEAAIVSHVSRYIEVDQQSRGLDDLKEEEILVTIGYSQECKKTSVNVLGDISSWIRRCLCIKQFSGCGGGFGGPELPHMYRVQVLCPRNLLFHCFT